MSYENQGLVSVGIAWETTFGQNGSGTLSYQKVPAIEATPNASQRMLDVNIMQQRLDARADKKVGPRDAVTYELKTYGVGALGSGITGTVPSIPPLVSLLQNSLGGMQVGKGARVSGTATTTQIPISTNSGSGNFYPGGAVAVISGGVRAECVPILSRSADILYLAYPLSFVPAANDRVLNGFTCYLTNDPTGSLQILHEGMDNEDKWVFTGLKGGATAETPVNDMPQFGFSLAGVDFHTGSSAALSIDSYTAGLDVPPVFLDSRVVLTDSPASVSATASLNLVDTPEVSHGWNIQYFPLPSPSGRNGVVRHRRKRAIPVAAPEISLYYDDNTMWTKWKNNTSQLLTVQVGSEAGNTIFFQYPSLQIVNVQRVGIAEETAGIKVSLDADIDRTTARGENEELAISAIKVTIF